MIKFVKGILATYYFISKIFKNFEIRKNYEKIKTGTNQYIILRILCPIKVLRNEKIHITKRRLPNLNL